MLDAGVRSFIHKRAGAIRGGQAVRSRLVAAGHGKRLSSSAPSRRRRQRRCSEWSLSAAPPWRCWASSSCPPPRLSLRLSLKKASSRRRKSRASRDTGGSQATPGARTRAREGGGFCRGGVGLHELGLAPPLQNGQQPQQQERFPGGAGDRLGGLLPRALRRGGGGSYLTAVSASANAIRGSPLQGGQHLASDGAQPTFGFTVHWTFSDSTTAFVGQCFLDEKGAETLETMWLLREQVATQAQGWKATRVGSNVFIRVK
ncbi:uncharacterized protein LOC133375596 [Rhineura floridana]|uniref:uncharacterized protein LOC133375596 n=1 Tax=Rhineura floridana TaxID=261503 RepID=UPI002AC85461|nr:uncharacterized protein LOC133375596 [Rhineura floridana]